MARQKVLHLAILLFMLTATFNITSVALAQCGVTGAPCTPTPIPAPTLQPQQPDFPDRDGDGVSDETDRCPDEGGPAWNDGCPFIDTDGDGTADEADNCPNQGGPDFNSGCPETTVPTPATVPVVYPDNGKCYVGNPNAFAVNRRKYPSLNAPITGQLQPGQAVISVSELTDINGLVWYALGIFDDPNSDAWVVDWVASNVVERNPACSPRLVAVSVGYEIANLITHITPIQVNAPKAVVQLCDGQVVLTYLVGDVVACDGTTMPFDGMASQIFCDSQMIGVGELQTCMGSDGIIIINGAFILPSAINLYPPDPVNEVFDDIPTIMTSALLNFGQFGEPDPDTEEDEPQMLVTIGFDGGLSEVGFNPQPEPPALDFGGNSVMFNPQPEPPASPFDIFENNGVMAMQVFDPNNPDWADWMQSYNLPPNSQDVTGFWLVDLGEGFMAIIPMSGRDLSHYGFNPQPEPPADDDDPFFGINPNGGLQLSQTYLGNLPSIDIVGFNPQPDPPAGAEEAGFNPQPEPPPYINMLLIDPDNYMMYDPTIDYNTTEIETYGVLIPLAENGMYTNMINGNYVICPPSPGPIPVPYPNTSIVPTPACVEFSAASN